MKALDARIVEALRGGAGDFTALRRAAAPCTACELRAGIQRLRWAGKVEMGALRLAPSMIQNSAEADQGPPPEGPAEPGPAQRRRAQEGAGAQSPDVPAPTPRPGLRGAGALERARARTAVAEPERSAPRGIGAAVREEAEVQAARRRAARSTGSVGRSVLVLTQTEAIATMIVEEPADAIRAVTRKWPDLWRSVVLRAREEGQRPGPMLFTLIERGLEAGNG